MTERLRVDYSELKVAVRRLARDKGALILAHNYQRPEVQDIADFDEDSLGLARRAAAASAELIVLGGVDFMAETAAILCPGRRVVIPEPRADCPMAAMVDVEELKSLKTLHPGAVVVCYVNTTAAVKAESDICCTSANATRVVQSIEPHRQIMFLPDSNLGSSTAQKSGRELILGPGFCRTHELITAEDVSRAREEHHDAKVVVHPECAPEVSALADAVESTSGMLRFCREDEGSEFIIGTELGMLHRLNTAIPGKRFHPVTQASLCPNMKLTTLNKVMTALQRESPRVRVDEAVRVGALRPVERMVRISP